MEIPREFFATVKCVSCGKPHKVLERKNGEPATPATYELGTRFNKPVVFCADEHRDIKDDARLKEAKLNDSKNGAAYPYGTYGIRSVVQGGLVKGK